MPSYLNIEEAGHVDYIFISHAHFDHLPGCDRLAKQTGATVFANGEVINMLRQAGVPDEQLTPVAGGERIPLFKQQDRQAASNRQGKLASGPPLAPPLPDPCLAALTAHAVKLFRCSDVDEADHDLVAKLALPAARHKVMFQDASNNN